MSELNVERCGKRHKGEIQELGRNSVPDQDLLMEQIFDNLHNSPVGKVLGRIASLPQPSRNKVLDVRKKITQRQYNLNSRLNAALDKVLEDLTA